MNRKDQLPGAPNKDVSAFDAAHASSYASGPPRQVPGLAGLHRMTSLLLAERVPTHGRVLVLGAGGGLELKALAEDHAGWTFNGVDPSAEMLRAAEQTVGPHAARVRLHQGYIDAAPDGPFDGAACLLTLHFVARDQRLETLREVRRRLVPDAPFTVAHISFPQTEPERTIWISRQVAFAGTTPANVESAMQAIATKLSILSPEEDEGMLRAAGFSGVSLYYAGLSFRG
jgi:tRNA (cmo5U34)-methyltransferase